MPKKDEDKANMNVLNAILTKAINTTAINPKKTTHQKQSTVNINNPQHRDIINGK
jgi:hypothetical protein